MNKNFGHWLDELIRLRKEEREAYDKCGLFYLAREMDRTIEDLEWLAKKLIEDE